MGPGFALHQRLAIRKTFNMKHEWNTAHAVWSADHQSVEVPWKHSTEIICINWSQLWIFRIPDVTYRWEIMAPITMQILRICFRRLHTFYSLNNWNWSRATERTPLIHGTDPRMCTRETELDISHQIGVHQRPRHTNYRWDGMLEKTSSHQHRRKTVSSQ